MKLTIISPSHVIDLNGLKELEFVRREDGSFVIGALTRIAEIESSEMLRKDCPILSECASQIADPLVRNLGTIGGNVSHADPTNDMPAVMVAADAEMVVEGPEGVRRLNASEFFLDAFTTALGQGEILKELRLPARKTKASAYSKLERQSGDFGIVGVGVSLLLSQDGRCVECGIGMTGAGPTVVRAKRAESAVRGTKVAASAIERAATLAAEDARPVADLRGSAEYKRAMVAVMTKRALRISLKRAGSSQR